MVTEEESKELMDSAYDLIGRAEDKLALAWPGNAKVASWKKELYLLLENMLDDEYEHLFAN